MSGSVGNDPAPTQGINSANGGLLTTAGQISWDGIVKTGWNLSVGLLSRFMACGVDPYTVFIAQKMGSQFQLRTVGRRRISEALSKLRSFRSLGAALWFGMGVKHLVKELGQTEEGQLCLTLCAAMTECYDTVVASEIILEMVKMTRAPSELLPAIFQWKSLLDTCAGTFSSSEFPQIAERYMALHEIQRRISYEPVQGRISEQRGCSSPKSLAEALSAISQVTRGELESITIIGGPDAGWLAAFAEWFFELTVCITFASTGRVLHSTGPPDEHAKVYVIYEDRSVGTTDIQTTGRTYRLLDATLAIQENADKVFGNASVTGRVPWNKALSSVFSYEMKNFLDNISVSAGAIGSLARVFQAVFRNEGGLHQQDKRFRGWIYHEPLSHSRRFISIVTEHFIELEPFRDIMERAAKKDVASAITGYETYTKRLKAACNCAICQGTFAAESPYCLVLMLEVIVIITKIMSTVDLPIPLSPSRLGFETIYAELLRLRKDNASEEDSEEYQEIGSLDILIWYSRATTLGDALDLFTGRMPSTVANDDRLACAASTQGICAYWTAIGKSSDGILSNRVTVVPGQILLHEKSYRLINDAARPRTELENALKLSSSLDFANAYAVIKETHSSLQLDLQIRDPLDNDKCLWHVGAASTIGAFEHSKGVVACGARDCDPPPDQVVLQQEAPGFSSYRFGQKYVYYIEADGGSSAQLWTLATCCDCHTIFVDNECLNCCLRTAVRRLQILPTHIGSAVIIRTRVL